MLIRDEFALTFSCILHLYFITIRNDIVVVIKCRVFMMKRKILCAFALLVMASSVDANPIYNLYRWAGEGIGLLEKPTPPPGLYDKTLSFFQTYILAPVASVLPESWQGRACLTLGLCTIAGYGLWKRQQLARRRAAALADAFVEDEEDSSGRVVADNGKREADRSDDEDKDSAPRIVRFKGQELIEAASQGNLDDVRLLLDQGADRDDKDGDYKTSLHFAAEQGHAAVVKLLLDKGAYIEANTRSGYTPLHFAAEQGHAAVVELLLGRGANVHAKDLKGHTARDKAASYPDIVSLLQRAERLQSDESVMVEEEDGDSSEGAGVGLRRRNASSVRLDDERSEISPQAAQFNQ